MKDGFTEHRYDAEDGLSLYYRRYGEANAKTLPVLCLSGLTRNSRDFHDLALRLGRDRLVICPDYRGRGRSAYDTDWRRYRPEIYLQDIIRLMSIEGLGRLVVIGTSLGGLLALGLATARPDAAVGIVLNDVGPDIQQEGVDRILAYIGRDDPQPDWETAVHALERRLPRLGLQGAEKWRRLAEGTYRMGDDGSLHVDWDINIARLLQLTPRPTGDLWPVFHALPHLPMLVIRGGQSDILTEATLARMIAARPDLRHVTLPGIGHVPQLDEPESLEAIDAFLYSIPAHA